MEGIKNSSENQLEELPKKILEIGAGFRSMRTFFEHTGKTFDQYITSDIDIYGFPSMGKVETNSEFVGATAYKLPFKDGQFGYVVARNFFGNPRLVLKDSERKPYHSFKTPVITGITPGHPLFEEKVKNLRILFKELHRVLSPKGEICIIETSTPEVAVELLLGYKRTYEEYFQPINKSSLISLHSLKEIEVLDLMLLTLKRK